MLAAEIWDKFQSFVRTPFKFPILKSNSCTYCAYFNFTWWPTLCRGMYHSSNIVRIPFLSIKLRKVCEITFFLALLDATGLGTICVWHVRKCFYDAKSKVVCRKWVCSNETDIPDHGLSVCFSWEPTNWSPFNSVLIRTKKNRNKQTDSYRGPGKDAKNRTIRPAVSWFDFDSVEGLDPNQTV